MLRKLEIRNSSGISETVRMDFTKGNYTFRDQYMNGNIVSPAIFYGTNASGKTSVLKTIRGISIIMNAELSKEKTYAMKNIDMVDEPTLIKLEVEIDKVIYNYEIEIEVNSQIISEKLEVDGNVFNRSSFIKTPSKESFIRQLSVESKIKYLSNLYDYFKKIVYISVDKEVYKPNAKKSDFDSLVDNNDKFRELQDFNTIMRLQFEKKHSFAGPVLLATYKGKKYIYNKMLSAGTRDFYETMSVVFDLEPGSLLVIDEIEKTLHPDLLREVLNYIVKEFDIQLVVSSHNTNLMKYLRPDQIFFTKKDNNDIVRVEKLSECHPNLREIHNLEKLYLGGKFGKW